MLLDGADRATEKLMGKMSRQDESGGFCSCLASRQGGVDDTCLVFVDGVCRILFGGACVAVVR